MQSTVTLTHCTPQIKHQSTRDFIFIQWTLYTHLFSLVFSEAVCCATDNKAMLFSTKLEKHQNVFIYRGVRGKRETM